MELSVFENDASIPQTIRRAALQSLPAFVQSTDPATMRECALHIAQGFGSEPDFASLFEEKSERRESCEKSTVQIFRKNIELLVQKTWVEKADEAMKEEVLARIDALCENLSQAKYARVLQDLLPVLRDVVYLLFGAASREEGFIEYAVRIDPDFGFFWLYVNSLHDTEEWPEEKCRAAVLLGLCFLASF